MNALNLARADASLWEKFPRNTHIAALLQRCRAMRVALDVSPVPEQWLYHPAHRTIFVWEPDLHEQSLSYLVVILAHELGHAMDFDQHPAHVCLVRDMHWSDAPDYVERAAFVNGFRILKELSIPFSLQDYVLMIDQEMGRQVRLAVEKEMCCLLSPRQAASSRRPSRRRPRQAVLHNETAAPAVAAPSGMRP